jgi:hypothetical protein
MAQLIPSANGGWNFDSTFAADVQDSLYALPGLRISKHW